MSIETLTLHSLNEQYRFCSHSKKCCMFVFLNNNISMNGLNLSVVLAVLSHIGFRVAHQEMQSLSRISTDAFGLPPVKFLSAKMRKSVEP